MQYMVIEKFKQGKVSWISEDVSTCYQLMETDDIEKFKGWISNWNDLVDFEIIPVITSRQAKEKVRG